jgi:DNA-binding CsgD family transcriptional regulator
VSTGWSGVGDSRGYLVVRAPALVAMARDLFEQYWARGAGLPTSRLEDGDDVRPVLELLQLGLKDESIARHLGVSLRTVRRRVAMVMDDLGASTRFQAGMEAARRGLI